VWTKNTGNSGIFPIDRYWKQPQSSGSVLEHNYNISDPHVFFMKVVSRIVLDPTVLAGKPVIRGTRISVDLVLELLASGWQEATILEEYPGLEHEDILACIRYAQEIVRSERVYSTSPQEKIAG
jgi:uncharacterized protein (DUF433 family)